MPEEILYHSFPTPVGAIGLAAVDSGLVLAHFEPLTEAAIRTELKKKALVRRYKPSQKTSPAAKHIKSAVSAALKYFDGELDALANISVRPSGTTFQQAVWRALRRIPPGSTKSYSSVASEIRNPAAVRAVGMACKRNPIGLYIPCHRVIGSNQTLTGFAGGLERKALLLSHEGHQLG